MVVMKLRIFTEPQQGATYDDLLAVAQAAERLGFDAFFRSDHYLRHRSRRPRSRLRPTRGSTLAGLARETSTIRLGTLVTPVTFRLPGPLAISVAQVDQMSGGRVELGLGTGWFDGEHTAYGIPFPPIGERFDRFEEQLEIITGLCGTPVGKTFSFEGSHYRVVDSPALPKPVQRPQPPIIIGGVGPKRTPRLAARFADEYNVPFHDPGRHHDRLRPGAAGVRGGRARVDGPVGARRPSASAPTTPRSPAGPRPSAGTSPDCARAAWRALPPRWSTRSASSPSWAPSAIYLQVLDLSDLDHLELLAAEVLPHV